MFLYEVIHNRTPPPKGRGMKTNSLDSLGMKQSGGGGLELEWIFYLRPLSVPMFSGPGGLIQPVLSMPR